MIKEKTVMRFGCYVFMIVSLLATGLQAQYTIRSPYLLNPELAIPYVDSCASFWSGAYDTVYGGFYTNIDRYGTLYAPWGTNKNLVTTSRDAYGFTRAYMLTGNEQYLMMARRALTWLYQSAWDSTYGGWYSTITRTGAPANRNENKTAFDQHYALLGIAAYFEATHDTLDWRWLKRGYESNESRLWDSSPQYFGYFDYAPANWSARYNKSFNATVDAITTHILSLYLLTGEERYRTRLLQLGDNMLHRLVASMDQQTIGFVEACDANWNWNNNSGNNNTRTIMGHVLKTAWCLGRLHQLFPDTAYVIGARKLIDQVWNRAYDRAFGGPYKDYDRVTGQMMMYGADTAKAWWQMEQAITGGLMLYDITRDPRYLEMADGSTDFFMRYFVDHQYREVYADRTRRGTRVDNWDENKGNSGKAAYHSTETGYYIYLYGKLLLQQAPATLHYKFMTDSTDRTFLMNPIAYASDKYRIREVRHDGTLYSDVNAAARTLHLSPGVGGHFTVTYEPRPASDVASAEPMPEEFALEQNYPNPFNPTTTLSFTLPRSAFAILKVFDVLGREVTTLVKEELSRGNYKRTIDASGLASGVYFYRLEAGNFVGTKKFVVLK
jgi:mannose/cellobiose epimerase-like protein (N-acyl-D-glucosamine 2-epimerase family)